MALCLISPTSFLAELLKPGHPLPSPSPSAALWHPPPSTLSHSDNLAMTSRSTARPNGQPQASKICQFKLVLLGESAVGKSSLVLRFVKGQFHEYQESTIGGEHFRERRALLLRRAAEGRSRDPNMLLDLSAPRNGNLWNKKFAKTPQNRSLFILFLEES